MLHADPIIGGKTDGEMVLVFCPIPSAARLPERESMYLPQQLLKEALNGIPTSRPVRLWGEITTAPGLPVDRYDLEHEVHLTGLKGQQVEDALNWMAHCPEKVGLLHTLFDRYAVPFHELLSVDPGAACSQEPFCYIRDMIGKEASLQASLRGGAPTDGAVGLEFLSLDSWCRLIGSRMKKWFAWRYMAIDACEVAIPAYAASINFLYESMVLRDRKLLAQIEMKHKWQTEVAEVVVRSYRHFRTFLPQAPEEHRNSWLVPEFPLEVDPLDEAFRRLAASEPLDDDLVLRCWAMSILKRKAAQDPTILQRLAALRETEGLREFLVKHAHLVVICSNPGLMSDSLHKWLLRT